MSKEGIVDFIENKKNGVDACCRKNSKNHPLNSQFCKFGNACVMA